MEKMYQEILQDLSCQLTIAHREKDESSERLRYSLLQIAQLEKLVNNILLSDEQQISRYFYPEAIIDETNRLQNCGYNHFFGDSPSRFSLASPLDLVSSPSGHSSPAISDSCSYSASANQMSLNAENRRDFETIVLETIGGVLPEYGKFGQAVSEAGQLLKSLLLPDPAPKWRNPPVHVTGQRPVMSNSIGSWSYGGLELGSGMMNRSFPCKKARYSLMS